jgi:hypothetical protein
MIISLFIVLQITLLLLITLHDWIHFPPLTNIRDLEKHSSFTGRVINSAIFFAIVFIPLMLTLCYASPYSFHVRIALLSSYGLLTLGTIMSWWIPYFFGGYSETYKAHFAEYKNTHHFLPSRGTNIIPNTFHVLMHVLIWSCFTIALYLSFQ